MFKGKTPGKKNSPGFHHASVNAPGLENWNVKKKQWKQKKKQQEKKKKENRSKQAAQGKSNGFTLCHSGTRWNYFQEGQTGCSNSKQNN